MKIWVEQFFKQHKGLAIAALVLVISMVIFLISKIFLSLDFLTIGLFCGFLLFSSGIIIFWLGSKSKKDESFRKKTESYLPARSYQQLLDETTCSFQELKKYRRWAYGCLLVGWIVFWVGRWSGYSPYNHPIFAIPVFVLAFLAAIRFLEKERELDVGIATCVFEGIEMECKRPELKSDYFHSLAKNYEGSRIWLFAFIRVSPLMLIIIYFLNVGLLPLLASHFLIPGWGINCGAGIILGAAFLFFARIACKPYYWLLERKKARPA